MLAKITITNHEPEWFKKAAKQHDRKAPALAIPTELLNLIAKNPKGIYFEYETPVGNRTVAWRTYVAGEEHLYFVFNPD